MMMAWLGAIAKVVEKPGWLLEAFDSADLFFFFLSYPHLLGSAASVVAASVVASHIGVR